MEDSLKVHFTLYPDKDLTGNYIYFLSYLNNRLYIGTNKGLNIFHNNKLSFMDSEEGYFNNEILCSENIGDFIYLGTKKGFSVIDSKLDFVNNYVQLELTNLRTIDSVYLFNKYLDNELVLDYNRNYFTIDYDYPNLINPKKDNFSIHFESFSSEDKWTSSSSAYKDPNKSTVRFLNLSPGKYRIAISVRNIHSNQFKKSGYFYFTINPPYWKTLPFYLIVSISFILVVIFLVRKKIEEITEREKANRRIAEVRMEALKSQMNPHFTFNVMNSIQNYVLDSDVDNALYFIGSFSKLVRTTLDHSFKKTITIVEELDFLNNYVEIQNMRFGNKVSYEMSFPEKYAEKIKIPPMLIQPLIENVFLHAFNDSIKSPKLQVKIYLDEDIEKAKFLSILVIDNGVGKNNKGSSHVSRGGHIIQERLTLLNTYNDVDSTLHYKNVEIGTEVHLKVPLILSF